MNSSRREVSYRTDKRAYWQATRLPRVIAGLTRGVLRDEIAAAQPSKFLIEGSRDLIRKVNSWTKRLLSTYSVTFLYNCKCVFRLKVALLVGPRGLKLFKVLHCNFRLKNKVLQ